MTIVSDIFTLISQGIKKGIMISIVKKFDEILIHFDLLVIMKCLIYETNVLSNIHDCYMLHFPYLIT